MIKLQIPYIPGLAPLLGLAPLIRLQILISAPPSDKRPLQISLDFDQISLPLDGEPELFLNQLTSKSLLMTDD